MDNTETFDFSQALTFAKAGRKIARQGWNGKGMWVALQVPDENSKMGKPYLYMSIVTGELVPWLASHGDILGDDWTLVPEASEEKPADTANNAE